MYFNGTGIWGGETIYVSSGCTGHNSTFIMSVLLILQQKPPSPFLLLNGLTIDKKIKKEII